MELIRCGPFAVDAVHVLGKFDDFGFRHSSIHGPYHSEPELGLLYGQHKANTSD